MFILSSGPIVVMVLEKVNAVVEIDNLWVQLIQKMQKREQSENMAFQLIKILFTDQIVLKIQKEIKFF